MTSWLGREIVQGMTKIEDEKPPGATQLLVKRKDGEYHVALYFPGTDTFLFSYMKQNRTVKEFWFDDVIEWKTL